MKNDKLITLNNSMDRKQFLALGIDRNTLVLDITSTHKETLPVMLFIIEKCINALRVERMPSQPNADWQNWFCNETSWKLNTITKALNLLCNNDNEKRDLIEQIYEVDNKQYTMASYFMKRILEILKINHNLNFNFNNLSSQNSLKYILSLIQQEPNINEIVVAAATAIAVLAECGADASGINGEEFITLLETLQKLEVVVQKNNQSFQQTLIPLLIEKGLNLDMKCPTSNGVKTVEQILLDIYPNNIKSFIENRKLSVHPLSSLLKDCVYEIQPINALQAFLDNVSYESYTQEEKHKFISHFFILIRKKISRENVNNNYLNIFKILTKNCNINPPIIQSATVTAAMGKPAILEYILTEYNIDLNAEFEGLTPLSLVLTLVHVEKVEIENSIKTMEILVKNGADINQTITINNDLLSLLLITLIDYKPTFFPVLEFLLKNGADVNKECIIEKKSVHALILAVELRDPTIIDLFENHGLDLNKVHHINNSRVPARALIFEVKNNPHQETLQTPSNPALPPAQINLTQPQPREPINLVQNIPQNPPAAISPPAVNGPQLFLTSLVIASTAALPGIILPIILKKFPIIIENHWNRIINIALPSLASAVFAFTINYIITNKNPDSLILSAIEASLILPITAMIEASKTALVETIAKESFNIYINISAYSLMLLVDFIIVHCNNNQEQLI